MTSETRFALFVIFAALATSARIAGASPEDQRYSVGDVVPLFVNKIGPLNNPSETYQYYDLPFCQPDKITKKRETLMEVLNGDRMATSLYALNFRENKTLEILCEKKLNSNDIAEFKDAISNDYYFQMTYDDLPLWGFIGKIEDNLLVPNETWPNYYLFRHVQFDVLYNENRVIEISAFSDPTYTVDITDGVETNVKFTYSVFWSATSTRFENRMGKYLRSSLHPQSVQLHWFSIINSVIIIMLSVGTFVMLFLQKLKNDITKYSVVDEEDGMQEVGWKHIHGDVFRFPPYTSLFCAVLGTGTQLLTLVFFVFVLVFLGVLYPYNRGALSSSLVIIYAITSLIGGYVASSFHAQLATTEWGKTVLLTGILYLGPVILTFSVLNTVAISYGATAALPFGTILVFILIWILVTVPLLTLGGMFGYVFRSEFQAPCATQSCPKEIPPLPWYSKTPSQIFLGGLLPFCAVFIELHYIYTSLWSHKIHTDTSILFILFILLIILTAILSVGMTYIQLSGEDHQWWWRSVLRGGSASIFMYGYSIMFYAKSSMTGPMQLLFFLGYNACICYAFFLMLGTIGFHASLLFVRRIYRAVKCE